MKSHTYNNLLYSFSFPHNRKCLIAICYILITQKNTMTWVSNCKSPNTSLLSKVQNVFSFRHLWIHVCQLPLTFFFLQKTACSLHTWAQFGKKWWESLQAVRKRPKVFTAVLQEQSSNHHCCYECSYQSQVLSVYENRVISGFQFSNCILMQILRIIALKSY